MPRAPFLPADELRVGDRGPRRAGLPHCPGSRPLVPDSAPVADPLATTDESRAVSEVLRGYGFSFEESTICTVFMQSEGRVNDHLRSCFRYGAPAVAAAALTPSLFTIRGAVAGTPPVNSSRKARFTNSGAPRM